MGSAGAIVWWAVGVLHICTAGAQLLPEQGCPAEDAAVLSSCLMERLEQLRPLIGKGIPEKNIPAGDPLVLDEVNFARDGLQSRYSNVIVHGFSGFQFKDLHVEPTARKVTFDLSVPRVLLTGDFDVTGSFLVIKVTSKGNFTSLITGAHMSGNGDLAVQKPPGGQSSIVQMENLGISLKMDQTQHALDFTPDTNPIIAKAVRHMVTNNDRVLLEEVQPEIEAKIAELMSQLVNQVLAIIPVDNLLD